MKKLLATVLIFIAIVFCSFEGEAQSDIHFSQYHASPLIVNPANAGLFSGKFRFNANYRRQWETVGEVFQTIGASADMLIASDVFNEDFFGLGVSAAQDQAGLSGLSQLDGALSASYTKILDPYRNHYLTLGAQIGYGQRTLDVSGLSWDNQWTNIGFNTDLPSGERFTNFSINFIDFGAGLNYFFSNTREDMKGHFGLAAYHLNRPDISLQGRKEELFVRYVANGGFYYYIENRSFGIFPNFLYIAQGPQQMLNVGVDFKLLLNQPTRFTGYRKETALSLGIYHRWNDSFFPMVKLSTGGFTLGLSYDLVVSNLRLASGTTGGPEISLIFRTGYKSGAKSQPKNQLFY